LVNMRVADKEYKPSSSETDKSGVKLDGVRKLELGYCCRTAVKADLVVEFIGGRIKVFEVDSFLIERLLEQLEGGEACTTAWGHRSPNGRLDCHKRILADLPEARLAVAPESLRLRRG
jgi:hypothetical protein